LIDDRAVPRRQPVRRQPRTDAGVLAKPKEGKYDSHNNNQTNNVDDTVHYNLLVVPSQQQAVRSLVPRTKVVIDGPGPAKQLRNHFLYSRKTPETAIWQGGFALKEAAMNAIVAGVLTHEAAKTQATFHPLTLIALLCGAGLLVSILFAIYGPAVDFGSMSRL
jgi:hypothetical protein